MSAETASSLIVAFWAAGRVHTLRTAVRAGVPLQRSHVRYVPINLRLLQHHKAGVGPLGLRAPTSRGPSRGPAHSRTRRPPTAGPSWTLDHKPIQWSCACSVAATALHATAAQAIGPPARRLLRFQPRSGGCCATATSWRRTPYDTIASRAGRPRRAAVCACQGPNDCRAGRARCSRGLLLWQGCAGGSGRVHTGRPRQRDGGL
jgi:hypothetical protein